MSTNDFRASPNDWKIKDVGGGNIEAVSTSTNEKFTGTREQFNTYIKGLKAFVDKPDWIPDGYEMVLAKINPSGQGIAFDEPTTAAIIAIAGDASSGSAAQIVDGYPVEVTGTSEVLVSAVPCDVVWIAHNGAAGTITVRDAGVTGTGITAVKTIDMATTPTMQPGSLRTQYGVTATLTAGKATFCVRPL